LASIFCFNHKMTAILHIAPRLPPAICGVGDYATLVGGRMEQMFPGVRCAYLACGHQSLEIESASGRNGSAINGSSRQHFWEAVRSRLDEIAVGNDEYSLVLHYVGYGYDRTGAPAWLAESLEHRPAWFGARRIVTFFHELYATGWPWQKAFWQSARQQAVAIRIARASDRLMTNRQASARWLELVTRRQEGTVPSLPVPSNVGEPDKIIAWQSRPGQAVCFGGARFKRTFFRGAGAIRTAEICKALKIGMIHSIGQRCEMALAPFQANRIDVNQTGVLAAEDVSSVFHHARLALVSYFPGYFAKSGVLAAAAAHGVPPVFACLGPDGLSDGLRANEHGLELNRVECAGLSIETDRVSRISSAIRAWYDGHDSRRHAKILIDLSLRDRTRPKRMQVDSVAVS
jgi:hypothetical protein